MGISIPHEHKPVVDFILHVIFGGLAFLLFFLFAVVTSQIVRWLEHHDYVPGAIAMIMPYAETAFFMLDLMLFFLFSLIEALKFIRDQWNGVGHVGRR